MEHRTEIKDRGEHGITRLISLYLQMVALVLLFFSIGYWTKMVGIADPAQSFETMTAPWQAAIAALVILQPVAALGLIILTILALQPSRREAIRFSAERFPVDAVEYLYESGFEPPGPVYNEFGWGGYLLYRAWPDIPVFIDGQTDFYGEELTKEYVAIRAMEPQWQDYLDKHEVRWAIIPPDVALNQGLALSRGWTSLYSDSTAVVWVREGR